MTPTPDTPPTSAGQAGLRVDDRRPLVVTLGALHTDCVVPDPRAVLLPRLARLTRPPLTWGEHRLVDAGTMRVALANANPRASQCRPAGSAYHSVIALAATGHPLRLGYVGVAGRPPAGHTHPHRLADHAVEHHLVAATTTAGAVRLTVVNGNNHAVLAYDGATDLTRYLTDHADQITTYLTHAAVVHLHLDRGTSTVLPPLLRAARGHNPAMRISISLDHDCVTRSPTTSDILDLATYLHLSQTTLAALRPAGHTGESIAHLLLRRTPPGAVVITPTATYTTRDGAFITEPHPHPPLPDHTNQPAGLIDADAILTAAILTAVADNPHPQRITAGVRLGLTLVQHATRHRDITGVSFRALARAHAPSDQPAGSQ